MRMRMKYVFNQLEELIRCAVDTVPCINYNRGVNCCGTLSNVKYKIVIVEQLDETVAPDPPALIDAGVLLVRTHRITLPHGSGIKHHPGDNGAKERPFLKENLIIVIGDRAHDRIAIGVDAQT